MDEDSDLESYDSDYETNKHKEPDYIMNSFNEKLQDFESLLRDTLNKIELSLDTHKVIFDETDFNDTIYNTQAHYHQIKQSFNHLKAQLNDKYENIELYQELCLRTECVLDYFTMLYIYEINRMIDHKRGYLEHFNYEDFVNALEEPHFEDKDGVLLIEELIDNFKTQLSKVKNTYNMKYETDRMADRMESLRIINVELMHYLYNFVHSGKELVNNHSLAQYLNKLNKLVNYALHINNKANTKLCFYLKVIYTIPLNNVFDRY